jgi:16S rRNA (cytidine1402-2'-O)-methyltransferase
MGGSSFDPPPQTRTSGTLFLVSLPIGNPEDITLRALRILREVGLIVAEDASATRALLSTFSIATPIDSLRPRHGVPARDAALAHLHAGRDVALVADSGTPLIVEPGSGLVQAALRDGARVTAAPGATACLAALVLSGLPTTPFVFLGFPPRRDPDRTEFFLRLPTRRETILLYESPAYLSATLAEIGRRIENNRKIVVACDLTHTSEQIFRGTISEAIAEYAGKIRPGSYAVVLSGKPAERP